MITLPATLTLPDTIRVTMSPRQLDPRWLTPDAAADFLGVSRSTFFRLQREGRLADVRTASPHARAKYYWQPDLERFLDTLYPPPPDDNGK